MPRPISIVPQWPRVVWATMLQLPSYRAALAGGAEEMIAEAAIRATVRIGVPIMGSSHAYSVLLVYSGCPEPIMPLNSAASLNHTSPPRSFRPCFRAQAAIQLLPQRPVPTATTNNAPGRRSAHASFQDGMWRGYVKTETASDPIGHPSSPCQSQMGLHFMQPVVSCSQPSPAGGTSQSIPCCDRIRERSKRKLRALILSLIISTTNIYPE